MVVLLGEPVEQCLEIDDGGRLDRLGAQPLLHRLLEPFDCAAKGSVRFTDDDKTQQIKPPAKAVTAQQAAKSGSSGT